MNIYIYILNSINGESQTWMMCNGQSPWKMDDLEVHIFPILGNILIVRIDKSLIKTSIDGEFPLPCLVTEGYILS